MDVELINSLLAISFPFAICSFFTFFIFLNRDKAKGINSGLVFFILIQLILILSLWEGNINLPLVSHIQNAWRNATN